MSVVWNRPLHEGEMIEEGCAVQLKRFLLLYRRSRRHFQRVLTTSSNEINRLSMRKGINTTMSL